MTNAVRRTRHRNAIPATVFSTFASLAVVHLAGCGPGDVGEVGREGPSLDEEGLGESLASATVSSGQGYSTVESVRVSAPGPGRTGDWWCTNHFGRNLGGRWDCRGVSGGACSSDAAKDATVTCGRRIEASGPRVVGILYSVWADHFRGHRTAAGQPYVMGEGQPYGGPGIYHWWGRPAYGGGIADYRFMEDDDPERPNRGLIDAHADKLHAAGVDFIAIDLSNGEHDLIVKAARAVARRYSERARSNTPQIALFVKNRASVEALEGVFFAGAYDAGVWFQHEGKPLILIAQADEAMPKGGALDRFTARRTWGLGSTAAKWSFKLNTDADHPGTAFYHRGAPEEMSVAAACQETYMTTPQGRKGRRGGAYFAEQWSYVLDVLPKFVFITAWNEWGSQNLGDSKDPVFTDTYGAEYSADLEPMRGGHGDQYYWLMVAAIADFKSR